MKRFLCIFASLILLGVACPSVDAGDCRFGSNFRQCQQNFQRSSNYRSGFSARNDFNDGFQAGVDAARGRRSDFNRGPRFPINFNRQRQQQFNRGNRGRVVSDVFNGIRQTAFDIAIIRALSR